MAEWRQNEDDDELDYKVNYRRDEAFSSTTITLNHCSCPVFLFKRQKLISLSYFKRVTDVYQIKYICKHCNMTHIFDI